MKRFVITFSVKTEIELNFSKPLPNIWVPWHSLSPCWVYCKVLLFIHKTLSSRTALECISEDWFCFLQFYWSFPIRLHGKSHSFWLPFLYPNTSFLFFFSFILNKKTRIKSFVVAKNWSKVKWIYVTRFLVKVTQDRREITIVMIYKINKRIVLLGH